MARLARIVVPGAPHHITQRGNNGQDVFFVDEDRRMYLDLLTRHAQRFGFVVQGYCLMTNHIHVIGVPAREDALAKTLGRTHMRYTQYVNQLHGRSGHLWQNRFYSCAMDDAHLFNALAYVENNPVRARMAPKAWEYPWSSAATHCGKATASALLDLSAWFQEMNAHVWRAQLSQAIHAPDCTALRHNTRTGRPLGGDSFLSKIETFLGRRVRPLPVGHPKLPKNASEQGKNAEKNNLNR